MTTFNATNAFTRLKDAVVETPLTATQGITGETGLSNKGGKIEIFVDRSGSMGLFVPFGAKESKGFKPDLSNRNLTLKELPSNESPIAELKLSEPKLESVLFVFVDEFVKSASGEPERAVTLLNQQLQKWRSLFTVTPHRKLSESAQVGLLCELRTLQELLQTDGYDAFDRWTGPDGSRYDFQLPNRDVECKATLTAQGLSVTIHGKEQLLASDDRPLNLLVRKYEKTPNGHLALSEIVGTLIQDERIPAEAFVSKLMQLDFSLQDIEMATESRFDEKGIWEFEVTEDFPRVPIDSIPDRVVRVQYEIDLNPPSEVPGFLGTRQAAE